MINNGFKQIKYLLSISLKLKLSMNTKFYKPRSVYKKWKKIE